MGTESETGPVAGARETLGVGIESTIAGKWRIESAAEEYPLRSIRHNKEREVRAPESQMPRRF